MSSKYLITITDYCGCDVIGWCTMDINQSDVTALEKRLENRDIQLCISCYDQGEYRISGCLSKFRQLPDGAMFPDAMHRVQMGGCPRPRGVPDMHLHVDFQVTHEVCIKDGTITYEPIASE